MSGRRFVKRLWAVVCASMMLSHSVNSVALTSEPLQDEARRIWDEGFLRKRPVVKRSRVPNHRYNRMTPPLNSSENSAATPLLGITLWRLRPSVASDNAESRDLVHDQTTNKNVELTAERLESEIPISEGELVRVSIESPRAGYLYVIDREQYTDNTLSDPTLIFPTLRINQGRNRVVPGQIVQIPSQMDAPPYLTVRPNPKRKDQVAEVLTVLVTTTPLDLTIPPDAVKIPKRQFDDWEKQWTAPLERLELKGGGGLKRTKAEKLSVVSNRRLRANEAPPQAIYRVSGGPNAPILVHVKLPFRRANVMSQPH